MKTIEQLLAEEALLTVAQAAQLLGMSKSWVYKEAEKGLLPHVVLGARLRFQPEALRAYVRDRVHGVPAAHNTLPFRTRG